MEQSKELTAREIFNRIVKGQTVRIPHDPVLANQLKNHLNVIKCREAKVFRDLGLDFISSIISVVAIETPQFIYDPKNPINCIAHYEIKLIAPKKRRKYSVFIIKNEESNSN